MDAPIFEHDRIVFGPDDVDLRESPLRQGIDIAETFVLGAFNPSLSRLPNGNLLMVVRIAEGLRESTRGAYVHAIRWDSDGGYRLDAYNVNSVDAADPRKFRIVTYNYRVMALTSLSWLLPVELSADGERVVQIHYDKVLSPAFSYQQYGVEDARVSFVDGTYYMTTCSVSAERHCTTLYTSQDGLSFEPQGIILDHQNKDMLFFEGKVNGMFYALTRPLGDLYFAYPPDSSFHAGPSINLSRSPDGLHWKPVDTPMIRPRRGSLSTMRMGGGAQPVLTDRGWLILYHGVQTKGVVGVYRTFWALADRDDPSKILEIHDERPLMESRPELTEQLQDRYYLTDVVFTTGIVDGGDDWIVASGELDLVCRITRIPKQTFA